VLRRYEAGIPNRPERQAPQECWSFYPDIFGVPAVQKILIFEALKDD
jgi:hypothetical protein